jgi:hypothetical protein
MKLASSILFERVNLFTSIFHSTLNEIGYFESELIFERLNYSGMEFPSIPVVQGVWKNSQAQMEFRFRIYENYFTDFEIFNCVTGKNISINDYKKYFGIDNLEIYFMSGNINQKYNEFLQKTLELIVKSDLSSILTGKNWIDIPFDWQNQK